VQDWRKCVIFIVKIDFECQFDLSNLSVHYPHVKKNSDEIPVKIISSCFKFLVMSVKVLITRLNSKKRNGSLQVISWILRNELDWSLLIIFFQTVLDLRMDMPSFSALSLIIRVGSLCAWKIGSSAMG